MKVAAVIPNWNGAQRLPRCLVSLATQTRPFDRVIVVDNGSTDGSQEMAQVRLPENVGFATAVNRGCWEAAGCDWIAVLNNDVALDPGWLEAMLAAQPFDVAGSRLRMAHNPRLLDGAGDAISMGLAAVRLGHGRTDSAMYDHQRPMLAVCFAAALINAEVFRRVGGLDERFFAYLEDVEFCLRARLAGFRVLYVPEAIALHEGSGSTSGEFDPRVVTWMTANQLLLAARYTRSRMWPRVLVTQALWAARMIAHGRFGPWLRGVGTGLPQWRQMRRTAPLIAPARLLALLHGSEKQIQADCGDRDRFWRAYFSLFG
jgi:GT2 family glycosyltransferase